MSGATINTTFVRAGALSGLQAHCSGEVQLRYSLDGGRRYQTACPIVMAGTVFVVQHGILGPGITSRDERGSPHNQVVAGSSPAVPTTSYTAFLAPRCTRSHYLWGRGCSWQTDPVLADLS